MLRHGLNHIRKQESFSNKPVLFSGIEKKLAFVPVSVVARAPERSSSRKNAPAAEAAGALNGAFHAINPGRTHGKSLK
jgi:hypothetical protein